MKTITYDETKFQLLPVSLDGNMITAAANTELLANRNNGEPASISDLWDALRAAAPQPECVEQTAANDAADAARWRYVRRKLCLNDNGNGTCSMHAINLPAACQGWPELGAVSEFCDAAIDAAIYASQEPSHDDQ